MTAFSSTDIPSSVDTLEKLAVWTGTVLNDLYADTTVVEAPDSAQIVATAYPYYITASDPDGWRLILRQSIGLQNSWRRGAKIWTYAQDLGTKAIPTEYKS